MDSAAHSQGNSSLPGNEIILRERFGFGGSRSTRDFDDAIENLLAHMLDSCRAANDGAGVEVNNVAHTLREFGVGGNFYDWRNGISRGRAKAGREEHDTGARSDLRGDAFHVTAGRALQVQTGPRAVFRIIEHRRDGRRAALLRGARGFHGVGKQSVLDISRRRIHFKAGANSFGARRVIAHELAEALGNFVRDATVDEILLDAAEFGEFRKDGTAAERVDDVGEMADGGIRGNPREAIRATAFESDGQGGEWSRSARQLVGVDQAEEG